MQIANDSDFGLSGAVHTKDIERGMRVARRVDTGMIHINEGQWCRDEFTTMKWISVIHGRRIFPY